MRYEIMNYEGELWQDASMILLRMVSEFSHIREGTPNFGPSKFRLFFHIFFFFLRSAIFVGLLFPHPVELKTLVVHHTNIPVKQYNPHIQVTDICSVVPYKIYINNENAFSHQYYPRQNALFKKL